MQRLFGLLMVGSLAITGCGQPDSLKEHATDIDLQRINAQAIKVPVMVGYAEQISIVQQAGQYTTCAAHLGALRPRIEESYREVSYLPSSWQQRRVQTIYATMLGCVPETCADSFKMDRCIGALTDLNYLFQQDPRFEQGEP